MNHKAHMIAGAATGGALGLFLMTVETKEQAITGAVACFLGSEFPDLDTGSIPSRMAARIGAISAILLSYYGLNFYAALIGIVYMIIKAQPHRGITHSYLLPVVCFLVAGVVFPQNAVMISCFGIGLLVHNVVDRRNPVNIVNWLPI